MLTLETILKPIKNYADLFHLTEQSPENVRKILLAKLHHKRSTFEWVKSSMWRCNHPEPSKATLYEVLVALAWNYPCDTTCSITQQEVDFAHPENYVAISEGHIFSKEELQKWLKIKFVSPVTNVPFFPEDERALRQIYPSVREAENPLQWLQDPFLPLPIDDILDEEEQNRPQSRYNLLEELEVDEEAEARLTLCSIS